jgi:dTDP-glucose 4,6-dehydratase
MEPPHERIVVLGSNSFSGASFARVALAEGAEVVGISRSPEPDPALLPYRWGDCARFRFHALDLNHDLDAILAVIEAFRPKYVVNFAAQSMVAESWQNPAHWYQTNVVATAQLIERLRRVEGLERYVHASTPEVYGSTSGLVTEATPFHPSTPYAVSKAACDLNLLAYHRAYGFPVAFTRAANVCGPGQPLYRILPRAALCAITGQRLRLEGGGTSRRAFIHIDDVADATLAIARRGRTGEAYHLTTPRIVTIREAVELVFERAGASFEALVDVAPARLAQDAAYTLDGEKARSELGWTPSRSLEATIDQILAWLRTHRERLDALPTAYVHKA